MMLHIRHLFGIALEAQNVIRHLLLIRGEIIDAILCREFPLEHLMIKTRRPGSTVCQ